MAIELIIDNDTTDQVENTVSFPCIISVIPLNIPQAASITVCSLESLDKIFRRALNVLSPETQEYKDFIGLADHIEKLLQSLRAQIH